MKDGELNTLIHPDAKVSDVSKVGLGSFVAQQAIVGANASIGENVIGNTRALIEHDCCIESHAHICPDVSLAGGVTVGEGSFVGLRSVVKDKVKIGRWARIGAGSVAVADVPDGAMVGVSSEDR